MSAGFWAFVEERERVRTRRQAGLPRPWTNDAALARYHFCNVRRRHDAGSVFFMSTAPRAIGPSRAEAVFVTVAYRLVNRADTFQAWLAGPGNGRLPDRAAADRWIGWLEARKRAGHKVFTGRHLNRGLRAYARTIRALDAELAQAAARWLYQAETLEDAFRALTARVDGLGRFFGWQVLCDLRALGAVPRWPDADDWAAAGPGAVNGLKAAFGEAGVVAGIPTIVSPKTALGCMLALRDEQPPLTDHRGNRLDRLTLEDVEHALCEYARYVRATDASVKAKGLEVKPWAR